MSVEAIAWALNHAPDLPPSLLGTLIGLANHAHADGTGAYPTQGTLAWYTRKDERQVRRDLKKLQDLKLIERGDQRMVAHIPRDERPVVYTLCVWRMRDPRPRPGRPGRPAKETPAQPVDNAGGNPGTSAPPLFMDPDTVGQTGHEKPGDVDDRPDVQGKTGGHPGHKPGDVDVRLTVPDQPSMNRPPAQRSVDDAAAAPGASTRGEDSSNDEVQWTIRAGEVLRDVTAEISPSRLPRGTQFNHLLDLTVAALRDGWRPGALTSKLTARELGTAQDLYEVLRHRLLQLGSPPAPPTVYRAPAPAVPAVLPWCRRPTCDEVTRQLLDDEGRPRFDAAGPLRCPDCSPVAAVLP